MRLTQKLLSFLNRVFDKDPAQFLALRLQYDGGMVWQVADGSLTTTVTGGSGHSLTVDLSQYSVAQLANFLGTQQGYSVAYVDRSELSALSALVLIDGGSDIALSNGDHLYGYTSELWSYMEAQSSELETAEAQIGEMLNQMSTVTASNEWLDELGSYYVVPRLQGELDSQYGPRIIAEVLRPRGNNVAMEAAIKVYTGQNAKVTDVTLYGATFPLYNGAITRNSAYHYNASRVPLYGLFDVEYGYDLINGGDITAFQQTVRDLINRLRDAGTHLRSLLLTGSMLADSLTPPTDGGQLSITVGAAFSDALSAPTDSVSTGAVTIAPMADTLTVPLDGLGLVVTTQYRYNSVRKYNGAIYRLGVSTKGEDVGTAGDIPFTALLTANGTFNADGSQVADGLL